MTRAARTPAEAGGRGGGYKTRGGARAAAEGAKLWPGAQRALYGDAGAGPPGCVEKRARSSEPVVPPPSQSQSSELPGPPEASVARPAVATSCTRPPRRSRPTRAPARRPFSPAQPRLGGGRSPGAACKYGGAAARGRGRGCSARRARVRRAGRGDPRERSGSGGPGPEARRPEGGREEGTPGVGSGARAAGEGAPEYWDRAGTGALGCWPGPRSLERGAEGGGRQGQVTAGEGMAGRPAPRPAGVGGRVLGAAGEPALHFPGPSSSSPSKASSLPPPPPPLAVFCCRSARAPGAVSRNLMRPNWLFM